MKDGFAPADDEVVGRFLASLERARRLPEPEIEALLRVADLDGDGAAAILGATRGGHLFGAGLRDLVGRHALAGTDLALFVLRDVLERPVAEAARLLGIDPRSARRRLAATRSRLGLADADGPSIGQWLVTELIVPPTRALQLRLFRQSEGEQPGEQRAVQEENHWQARLAFEEGEPRA